MFTGHTPLNHKFKAVSFLAKIKERYVIKKQNTNIAFTGENRSGKSYSGLKYCRLFSQEITHTPFHIIFTYEEFFKLANDFNINNCVILFDEVGSESRSERYWEIESQNFGEILELWGMKNCILLLTLPNWGKLTGAVKGMMHFRASCFVEAIDNKSFYMVQVGRKFQSWKKDKELFVPFKTLIVDKDDETDKLYEEYYPNKIKNYSEKMQEMQERLSKNNERPLPIKTILSLRRSKIIDDDFAHDELVRNGFNYARADLILESKETS